MLRLIRFGIRHTVTGAARGPLVLITFGVGFLLASRARRFANGPRRLLVTVGAAMVVAGIVALVI